MPSHLIIITIIIFEVYGHKVIIPWVLLLMGKGIEKYYLI